MNDPPSTLTASVSPTHVEPPRRLAAQFRTAAADLSPGDRAEGGGGDARPPPAVRLPRHRDLERSFTQVRAARVLASRGRAAMRTTRVLVRVHATTVTRTDCHMRAASPFIWRFMLGLRRPTKMILGLDFAARRALARRSPILDGRPPCSPPKRLARRVRLRARGGLLARIPECHVHEASGVCDA